MVKLLSLLCLSTLAVSTYATNIRVNKGCILLNNNPSCAGGTYWDISTGAATIYARFDGNDKNDKSTPGCKLNAKWPKSYGDVYYGANNCLYDGNGGIIDGQCCNQQSGLPKQINPYR